MWLDMPTRYLRMFREMLPRLEAQEMLNDKTVVALGSGTMKKDDQRRINNSLLKAARPQPVGRKAKNRDEYASGLASFGIAFESPPAAEA